MSRFWKRFLREGQGLFARGTRPQIWLGAFGKHPGWDDHIDDIGLETDSLLLAKQILYVDGIGGQISSGEWEKLDSAQRLGEFKHVFLWKRGDAFRNRKNLGISRWKESHTISSRLMCSLRENSVCLGTNERFASLWRTSKRNAKACGLAERGSGGAWTIPCRPQAQSCPSYGAIILRSQ